VDGGLSSVRIAALQAHLADCDRCTRFGGDVVRLLTALRAGLTAPPSLPEESAQRLHARLTDVMRNG
jgi:anti-sigma factor RsiW